VGEAAFFSEAARNGVTAAVVDVESRTAAEIVVVMRRASATYRELDLYAGAAAAFGVLLVLLFHPMEVSVRAMPADVLLAFVAGAVLVWGVAPVKRALLRRSRVDEAVRTHARAVFVDQGVSRTSKRTGVLVYVSTFERRVELVPDVGVDGQLVAGPARAMTDAVAATDLDGFLAALRTLGPSLEAALPRGEDDVNELPDAPVMS
jgi:putative membrane protein